MFAKLGVLGRITFHIEKNILFFLQTNPLSLSFPSAHVKNYKLQIIKVKYPRFQFSDYFPIVFFVFSVFFFF